jgi:Nuclease-related domain
MSVQRLHAGDRYRDIVSEQDVADMLDRLGTFGVVTLHGVRLRRRRAIVDHIAVAPSGVYVIDTKMCTGRVELKEGGSELKPDDRLLVAGRDRTRLAADLLRKVSGVRGALGDMMVPVHAALCFIDGDWPLRAKPFDVRGVTVMWSKELERRVAQLGRREAHEIAEIASRLQAALHSQ